LKQSSHILNLRLPSLVPMLTVALRPARRRADGTTSERFQQPSRMLAVALVRRTWRTQRNALAEADRFFFSYKEPLEELVKKQDIHEGLWMIYMEFGIQGANAANARTRFSRLQRSSIR
jgi:hypothetical protein